MQPFVEEIKKARSIILSTHAQPDGDGLGCQVALYWALKKNGAKVRIVNVDEAPRRYNFLNTHGQIETFDNLKSPIEKSDLALIFDTNDPRLLPGLWNELKSKSSHVAFVDHHPLLEDFPLDLKRNMIDVEASSNGQIVFNLIKALGIPLDGQIAMPLYASIVFDTNYFRFIRGSPTPHLIAAELLKHGFDAHIVHRHLFGNHTINKIKFISQILNNVEYEMDGTLACIPVKKNDLKKLNLELDDTRDVVDMIMNIESVEAAVMFREDEPNEYKLSFRSKGNFPVNGLATTFGGGGHAFAAGAYVKLSYDEIKRKIIDGFKKLYVPKS